MRQRERQIPSHVLQLAFYAALPKEYPGKERKKKGDNFVTKEYRYKAKRKGDKIKGKSGKVMNLDC